MYTPFRNSSLEDVGAGHERCHPHSNLVPARREAECFDHAKAVLRTLAGNRPEPRTVAYTSAKTEVIEDAMMEMEPMEGLRQLLDVKQESHEYARSPRQ
jgi:hypothetical protein